MHTRSEHGVFSPFALAAGTLIGERYRIDHEIGTGAMGVVYRATDTRLGRPVALKLMTARSKEARARFMREAKAAARISHPSIVDVYEVNEHAGVPFLVMELLRGVTLRQRLAQSRLPADLAVSCMGRVAAAMAEAHRRGMVHRDLKPDNIFLDVDGAETRVVIVDFGLAFVLAGDAEEIGRLTAAGRTCGTPDYMSPEQCTAGEITAASDVYSLGCLLHELLTGTPPFHGDATRVMTSHVYAEAHDLAARRPDLPMTLTGLVTEMLLKDPTRRPSMGAVASRLAQAPALTATPNEHDDADPRRLERMSRVLTAPDREPARPELPAAPGTRIQRVLVAGDISDELRLALAVRGMAISRDPSAAHDVVLATSRGHATDYRGAAPVVLLIASTALGDVGEIIRSGIADVIGAPCAEADIAAKLARAARRRRR